MSTERKVDRRVKDMTEGNPLRLILEFAIPIFIGNIFQQIYSMVDTMVVGYALGDQAIAAIGATASLYLLIMNFAWGLNNGYAIIITQRFGARNKKEIRQSIAGTVMLNVGVTVVLTVCSLLFLRPLMEFMNTPEGILEQAYIYIAIVCAGMATTIGYNMFAGILRAMGNSRSPLYFLIVSCLLNVILDVLFVMGLHMGVAGAAIATVIAQAVSAILCGKYVFRNYKEFLPERKNLRVSKKLMLELASAGFGMALMVCVVDLGSVIFQRANNLLGETLITAHAAVRRILQMLIQPLSTISAANATFIGQNWGAGKPERIREAMKKALGIEILWSLIACAFVYLFGEIVVQFTTGTTNAEVIRNAALSLRVHFTFCPALGILSCLRTAMQAMGRKLAPIFSSCIELCMKIIAARWLIPTFGFLGTSITEPVTWVIMAVFLSGVFLMQRKKIYKLL